MKDGPLLLSEKTREELIETILRQQKEIEVLKKKLGDKEQTDLRKKFLKLQRLQQRVKRARRPGQKLGHIGLTRIKPKQIDRVIEQTLKVCPDCHHRLSASQEVVEHLQEDIIPAQPQVTLFRKHRYWCQDCRKLISAGYAAEEVPHGYLGPNVLVQTLILKYHHGLPFNKIQELFENLCHFKVSQGALAQALQRMSQWLGVEVDEILAAVRASPHIHMDETGWNISGSNHWLWAAVNKRLAYYRVAKSRGAKIAKEIIPKDYSGVLVTDFYAAYNGLPGKKQKCLVHLMREMHSLYLKDSSEAFGEAHKRLKRIIGDALRLKDLRPEMAAEVYERRFWRLKQRLFVWASKPYRNKHLLRLSKRFLSHWLHLLTFLERPDVSFHNNLAERMIRHHVILRNRSFQNRSQKGAHAHEVLMSLLHTLQLQGKEVFADLKTAYLSHRQGFQAPLLQWAK